MKKSIFTYFSALFFVLISLFSFPKSIKSEASDGLIDYINSYVADGLVSLYSGKYNTKAGYNAASTKWENLVGESAINLTLNKDNVFTEDAFHLKATKQYFPASDVATINGDEFTFEFLINDLLPIGYEFNTFVNSDNDNFALFRRVASDILEFKFAAVAQANRPTISNAQFLLNNSLVSITYKVGGKVRIYINGAFKAEKDVASKMGADTLFFGHNDSTRSFEANFKTFRIYNKELTSSQIQANATTDGMYGLDTKPPFNEVALGETNIVGGVNSIRRINTSIELTEVVSLTHLPQTIIYKLDSNLNLVLEDNVTVSLSQAIDATNKKIIPAFDIDSEATVTTLVSYLNRKQYFDCFVLSSNPAIVKSFRSRISHVPGVIDYQTALKEKDTLSKADMLEIRQDMHKNFGTVAILPVRLTNRTNVQYLFESIVNVWSVLDTNSNVEIYQGIVSGAIGVITDETEIFYQIAKEEFANNAMTRLPLNIGHRGLPTAAPENTLEGAILAYQAGANVIEVDVYVTKDSQLVIMHDPTTGRTSNLNLNVEDSTLSQLKELYVNKNYEKHPTLSQCRIPTLEEFLVEFKDKDVRLFIEIKTSKASAVPLLKALIEQYDMHDQVSFITFIGAQLANLNTYYPEATTGYLLSNLLDEKNSQEDMLTVMKTIGQYNATLNPNYAGYGKNAALAALSRGIAVYPWTLYSDNDYSKYFLNGYAGLTGDVASKLGPYAKTLSVANVENDYEVGDLASLDVSTILYNRNVVDVSQNATIKVIGGANTEVTGNQIKFLEEGVVYFVVSYEIMINPITRYSLYSDVIEIKVNASSVIDPGEGNPNPGEGGVTDPVEEEPRNLVVPIVIGSVTIASGSGVGLFFILRNIKRKKALLK